MKKKKAERPSSPRSLADDSKLQKESAFQQLFAQWLGDHTEQHGRLIRELTQKGYSGRCIARNLPGPPKEWVVRALKNKAESITERKQEVRAVTEAAISAESGAGQPDQPTTNPPHPPGQFKALEWAKLLSSKEEKDREHVLPEAQSATAQWPESPQEFLERRTSEEMNDRRRSEEEYRARSKASRSNVLEKLKLKTIL